MVYSLCWISSVKESIVINDLLFIYIDDLKFLMKLMLSVMYWNRFYNQYILSEPTLPTNDIKLQPTTHKMVNLFFKWNP